MTTINYSSPSKFSECRVRGWEPKEGVFLKPMKINGNESDVSHEHCRTLCKNQSECISWSMSNGAGCRYSNVELNVSNVKRTNLDTDWIGFKNGNDIKFISTLILLNKTP